MPKRKIGSKVKPNPEYHNMKKRNGSEFQVFIHRNRKGINTSLVILCSEGPPQKINIHPSNQLSPHGWKRELVSIFKETFEEIPRQDIEGKPAQKALAKL
jgi:hypothetical protein